MALNIDISAFRDLYPFQSHYASVNGRKYHYVDEGTGEAAVMLHGNPTWSFYYRELIKKLSPDFRAVCPDHIGCGLSETPPADKYGYHLKDRVNDLEVFIDQLGLDEPFNLIVHDWGGFIGCTYALRHHDRIKRLVITNTAAFLKLAGKPLPLRLRIMRHLTPFAVPAVLGANMFSRAAVYMAPKKKLAPAVKAGLLAPYNNWNNRIATLKFVQDIALAEGDPSYKLGQFMDDNLHQLADIPMMICWGMHDFVFDRAYFAEWRRRFPDAEYHTFETAGHYLLEDEPEAVGSLVAEFLKRPLNSE